MFALLATVWTVKTGTAPSWLIICFLCLSSKVTSPELLHSASEEVNTVVCNNTYNILYGSLPICGWLLRTPCPGNVLWFLGEPITVQHDSALMVGFMVWEASLWMSRASVCFQWCCVKLSLLKLLINVGSCLTEVFSWSLHLLSAKHPLSVLLWWGCKQAEQTLKM